MLHKFMGVLILNFLTVLCHPFGPKAFQSSFQGENIKMDKGQCERGIRVLGSNSHKVTKAH